MENVKNSQFYFKQNVEYLQFKAGIRYRNDLKIIKTIKRLKYLTHF